jgi:uncharacterized protein YacL
MKFKYLFRPSIAIVFGFIGVLVARSVTPPQIFAVTGEYFLLVAFLTFATFGFLLPDILELAGKAGLAVLARQIAERIPDPRNVSKINFRRRAKVKKNSENLIVVDTSVLIDGRLLDVASSGFLSGKLLIIPSVLTELQRLADNGDDIKRGKGRRGLDVLRSMQKLKTVKVDVLKQEPEVAAVDIKLVETAKRYKAKLMTVDFNLNKVSKVRGIEVLNINELANALKTSVLPNEHLNILISAKGKEEKQGVGYLPDGTMVVVEDGLVYKGKVTDVVVKKVIATNAGKMIFARVNS